MNGTGDNNLELAAMKKLLNSWHVGILYELFREEDITIDELKMMQLNHINLLLKNYKMGVKIRFEHYFNNWRNKIGLPLKTEELSHHAICCCHRYKHQHQEHGCNKQHNIENIIINTSDSNGNNGTKRKRQNTDVAVDQTDFDEPELLLSPQSVRSEENAIDKMLVANEVTNFTTAKNRQPTNTTDDEVDNDNLTLNALADLLSNSVTDEVPPKFPSKPTPDKCPVTLVQILQLSGPRGMSIVNFYKEKKHLTNVHRTHLIQTIVEFFVDNDYHLTLNASHNLEWEILKMFPTEKLEYYRTEKRGKIYVKFSNMKRYKRERNIKVNTEMETISLRPRRYHPYNENSQTDALVIDDSRNVDTTNYDEWPKCAEPEIEVKEEDLTE